MAKDEQHSVDCHLRIVLDAGPADSSGCLGSIIVADDQVFTSVETRQQSLDGRPVVACEVAEMPNLIIGPNDSFQKVVRASSCSASDVNGRRSILRMRNR